MNQEDTRTYKFNRIVYFDEPSATDLIYLDNKGQILKEIESIKGKNVKVNSDIDMELGTSFSFLTWFKSKINVDGGVSLGHSSEKLISQVINNTTLTDYLDLPLENYGIEIFENVIVYPYPNSLTYFKLLTPYMAMTEGSLDAGDLKINAQLMDSAIEKGKGYFELIALIKKNEEEKIILRFNLSSFKYSYSLADLVKMNLTYHAVKVGEMSLDKLNIESEFKMDDSVDGYLLAKEEIDSNKDTVSVYDVILAGVSHD